MNTTIPKLKASLNVCRETAAALTEAASLEAELQREHQALLGTADVSQAKSLAPIAGVRTKLDVLSAQRPALQKRSEDALTALETGIRGAKMSLDEEAESLTARLRTIIETRIGSLLTPETRDRVIAIALINSAFVRRLTNARSGCELQLLRADYVAAADALLSGFDELAAIAKELPAT